MSIGTTEFDVEDGQVYTVEVAGEYVGYFRATHTRHVEATCTNDYFITLHPDGPRPLRSSVRQPFVGRTGSTWAAVFALPEGSHRVRIADLPGTHTVKLREW